MSDEASCLNCALAQWSKTTNGRLRPGGGGRCGWKMPEIPLAKAFHWIGSGGPKPLGGFISRRDGVHTDCPAHVPMSVPPAAP